MYEVDTFGSPKDWNAAAVEAADRIKAHRLSQHSGAMAWWKRGVFVIFGSHGQERIPAVVELLRQRLEDLSFTERGFGVDSEDGYTWAMLVERTSYATDERVVVELAKLATEARRVAFGEAPETKDPNWKSYNESQGLPESGDLDDAPQIE